MSPSNSDSTDGEGRGNFPIGGGEVAETIRTRDWSSTPLGRIDKWPLELRTSVQNALSTDLAMCVLWGEELLEIYNDEFAALMGRRPDKFARPARENWSDLWDDLRETIREVRNQGCTRRADNVSLVVERDGFVRTVVLTLQFSPLFENTDRAAGVAVYATDVTCEVVARRRLDLLHRLGDKLEGAPDSESILRCSLEAMSSAPESIPFGLFYVQQDDPNRARLFDAIHLPKGTTWSPNWVELPAESVPEDSLAKCMVEGDRAIIEPRSLFGPAPEAVAEPVPERAIVVPLTIGSAGAETHIGCFVFGINPSLEFDDGYRHFLEELGREISTAYTVALQREEALGAVDNWSDLTRQKIETRRLSERSCLLDSMSMPFYALDDEFNVVYVNDAVRDDPHWKSKKVLGQCFWSLFPWTRRTDAFDCFQHTASSGEATEFEVESPENHRVYEVRAFPWEHGISVVFDDITEQRRTSRALERSEARFRAVVDHSLDVVAITDAEGHIEFISAAAEQIFGRTIDELMGTPPEEVFTPEGARRVRGAIRRLSKKDGESVKFQLRVPRPDLDETYWISVRGRDLRNRPGVDGLLFNLRDITEIKRYEADLVEAKERAEEMTRLKSNMLTNMSHEIRTPLTSLIGMAHVLAEKVPDEFVESIREIERSGTRLNKTLESVLTLAKIESGDLEVAHAGVDLVAETHDAVGALRKLADSDDLELRVVTEASPVVCADASFVTSILNNLVSNAIKFTDEGRIELRVRADDTRGVLEVEDTGIGIGADFLPMVFEEFRQASSGLSRSHGGAGVGLTIVKRMTEQLDGTISVLTTPGAGSTFTVTIPLVEDADGADESAEPDASEHPDTESSGETPSILVVEDETPIRQLLVGILEEHFDITAVRDGGSALEAASDRLFDLVVMDIGLPDISGVEALERLRELPGWEDRPIVALSGYAPEDDDRLGDHQFSDYITKPFDPDELLEQLLALV